MRLLNEVVPIPPLAIGNIPVISEARSTLGPSCDTEAGKRDVERVPDAMLLALSEVRLTPDTAGNWAELLS
jgi:hypothetical protein